MVLESTIIPMVQATKANGLKMFSMEREKKYGLMELTSKGPILMAKKRGMESFSGMTGPFMMENLETIILKELEHIHGGMVVNTMVNGTIIKCMEKVNLNGQTERNISVMR